MKWSWKIARLADIDVYVHATFFILIAWIGLSIWQQQANIPAVINGIGFILILFVCVVLHEFGHALTARRFGIRTRHITLLPIGGVASLERMPDDPKQEFLVALAGPAVNVVIALGLWLWLQLSNGLDPGDASGARASDTDCRIRRADTRRVDGRVRIFLLSVSYVHRAVRLDWCGGGGRLRPHEVDSGRR